MTSSRTRLLLGGGSVLLPLFMFAFLWVVTMAAPSVRVPGGSIYVCLLVAVVGCLKLQTTKAFNELEAARFSLTSSEKAITSANESFKIIQAKYQQQQVLLIEFLEAQNRVTTAKLQLILARFDVLQKEMDLKETIGF